MTKTAGRAEDRTAPMDPLVAKRRARVLSGHWDRFPVNPAKFDLRLLLPRGWFARGTVQRRLALARREEERWQEAAAVAAGLPPPERLAWYRASLTLVAVLLDRFRPDDYPYGPWGFVEGAFEGYCAVPWVETGIDAEVYVRDAIELVVWRIDANTYSLYAGIPMDLGEVVESILTEMLAEVRRHGLGNQEVKLLDEWATFAAAHDRYDDLVPLAYALGSRKVFLTQFLAEVAEHADSDLSLQVFAASNRPGPEQDRVVSACVSMFSREPPRLRAPIRAI